MAYTPSLVLEILLYIVTRFTFYYFRTESKWHLDTVLIWRHIVRFSVEVFDVIMVFRPFIVLYCVISHVTCHSDHVPVGLLPGSGNPWDALRPHTHESAPEMPWSLPGASGSDAIGDNDQQEQSIDLRMPGIRPSTVSLIDVYHV